MVFLIQGNQIGAEMVEPKSFIRSPNSFIFASHNDSDSEITVARIVHIGGRESVYDFMQALFLCRYRFKHISVLDSGNGEKNDYGRGAEAA